MNNPKRFWRFRSSVEEDSAELLLYGPVADETWWGDEITPALFNSDLAELGGVRNITLRINSYGGDVFAAHAIYNSLLAHPARVRVRVDGIAASAATIVMLAGDEILMPENAMIMIHNPWTIALGDARELRKAADVLDTVRETMLAAYESRTGRTRGELISMMNSETWMTADEAVEQGFADRVERNRRVPTALAAGKLVVNGVSLDLSRMRMVPVALIDGASTAPEPAADIAGPDEAGPESNKEGPDMGADTQPEPEATQLEEPSTQPQIEPEAEVYLEPEPESEVEAAIRAERARIRAIDELAVEIPGAEAAAFRAKYEEPVSVEQFAVAALRSEEVRSARMAAARRADAKAAGLEDIAPADEQASRGDRAAAMIAEAANQRRR